MTTLEESLVRTLRARADEAPLPDPDLLDLVDHGHMIRRRRRFTVYGAAALAVACTATALVARPGGGPGPSPEIIASPSGSPSSSAKPVTLPAPKPRPLRDLWPDAVHTVPGTIDGAYFSPHALADDRTLVGYTGQGPQSPGSIYAYDLVAKRATKIADLPVIPGKARSYAQIPVAGQGVVAFVMSAMKGPSSLWTVPVKGGVPRKIADVSADASPDRLEIVPGALVWSGNLGGLHRVPLTGGVPQEIPGTSKLRLASWPWATALGFDPPTAESLDDLELRPGPNLANGTIRNLETGEERVARLPKGEWSCSPTWCGGGNKVVGRDGVVTRRLPGQGGAEAPALDRFVTTYDWKAETNAMTVYLTDLDTGTTGSISYTDNRSATEFPGRLWWQHYEGGYVIADLAAIA